MAQVEDARRSFEREVTEHLTKQFPHWDKQEVPARLPHVPPFLLLSPELTAGEEKMRSNLSVDFAVAFLRASYALHLGDDPLRREFRTEQHEEGPRSSNEEEELQGAAGRAGHLSSVVRALRNNRPRYTAKSHPQVFDEARTHPAFEPFVRAAFSRLVSLGLDEARAEEGLLRLTFRLSLPYAHSIVASKAFIESMVGGRGPLASSYNHFRIMGWMCSYSDYLEGFENPNRWNLLDLGMYVPFAAELMSIDLGGTFAEELYTGLDGLDSAPDEEFDD